MTTRADSMPTTEDEARLKAALPEGWYAGNLTVTVSYEPRPGHSAYEYELPVRTGRPIGPRGGWAVMRKLDLTIRSASIDGLEAALGLLPSLDVVFQYPLDTRIDFSTYDD